MIRLFQAASLVVYSLGLVAVLGGSCVHGDDGVIDKIQEPKLAEELRIRFESDQAIRTKFTAFYSEHKITDEGRDLANLDPQIADKFKAIAKQIEEEDTKNRIWMKEVVRKYGWPGKSLVGAQAAIYAWLLVQHADNDHEFQQECLEKMEALPKGEVRVIDIAYLTDRVLCGTGKKQKYGTQVDLKAGKFIPKPIDDEENVDERRKSMGMEPLADYLKTIEKVFTNPNELDGT